MKKIDWYIMKKILATFIVAIMLIILVIIVIDASTKLDDFIEKKAPLKAILLDYCLPCVPYFFSMFGHLFFFIAVVYVTSKMTQRSETVAILCSGISFKRMLKPFIISSIIAGIFGLYLSNYLVPSANVTRYAFEQQYYRNQFVNSFVNIHIQTSDSTQIYVHHFDNFSKTGFMFTKEIFHDGHIAEKIYADRVVFDTATERWTAYNFNIRKVDGKREQMSSGGTIAVDLQGIMPDDFNNILRPDVLNFNQLNRTMQRERMKGTTKVRDLKIEKYSRLFNPLAYVIMTLIGVSLSCKKTRGGTGLNLAIGIGLAFSMILLMKIFKVSATNGTMSPMVATLIPLILYSLIAAYLLKRAPK